MTYPIKITSTYATKVLEDGASGYIHSVYNNTINIMISGHLLAIQSDNSPVSPLTLMTNLCGSKLSTLSVIAGQPVKITDKQIVIFKEDQPSFSFDLKNTEIKHLSPETSLSLDAQKNLETKISEVINRAHTSGFDLIFNQSDAVNESLILAAAKNRISSSYRFLLEYAYSEAVDELCKLIGLGIGLTPSGDDFLCGLLAGLHLIGKQHSPFALELKNAISRQHSNTNEISQSFLVCALEAHYSLPVNMLWTGPDTCQIKTSFQEIGHSSGMDTLCGIYYALCIRELI